MSRWTLAELTALAARALAQAEVHTANARVTDVPDARLVRWYTTIGLLDRPTLGSGRIAHYGMRQLLQLVAIKRLQAQGLPLAQIQLRLAGATDAQLRRIADLPAGLTEAASPPATDESTPFWTRRPAATATATPSATASATPSATASAVVDRAGDTVTRVYGLRLSGLTLLLSAQPAAEDLDEIAAAARPLLDLLAARALIRAQTGTDGPLDPTEGTPR